MRVPILLALLVLASTLTLGTAGEAEAAAAFPLEGLRLVYRNDLASTPTYSPINFYRLYVNSTVEFLVKEVKGSESIWEARVQGKVRWTPGAHPALEHRTVYYEDAIGKTIREVKDATDFQYTSLLKIVGRDVVAVEPDGISRITVMESRGSFAFTFLRPMLGQKNIHWFIGQGHSGGDKIALRTWDIVPPLKSGGVQKFLDLQLETLTTNNVFPLNWGGPMYDMAWTYMWDKETGILLRYDSVIHVPGGIRESLELIRIEAPRSTITCQSSSTRIKLGESVQLTGSISPGTEAEVSLTVESPSGSKETISAKSNAEGKFASSLKPDKSGSWRVTVSWKGYLLREGSTSAPVTITVEGEAVPPPRPENGVEKPSSSPDNQLLLIGGGVAGLLIAISVLFFKRRKPSK